MILGTGGDNPLQPFFLHLNETLKATREAAAAANVPYVDLRAAMLKATEDGKRWAEFHLGAGNCHPNDAGHKAWAESVFAAVQAAVGKTGINQQSL
jgi:lysophospholipase L1-like esterase